MAEFRSDFRDVGDTPSILRAVAGELDALRNHVPDDVDAILYKIAGIIRIEALRVQAGATEKGAEGL